MLLQFVTPGGGVGVVIITTSVGKYLRENILVFCRFIEDVTLVRGIGCDWKCEKDWGSEKILCCMTTVLC